MAGLFFASFTPKNDIVLSDEPIKITPEGFYIASVVDERAEQGAIATLVVNTKNNKPETEKADLQGGTAIALSRFISRNLNKDTSLRAVHISIKDFKLTESLLPNGGVDGRIQLSLSFGQPKDYGIQQLVAYQGGLHYIRPLANNQIVEAQLRGIIKSGLVYFNNWMRVNIKDNPKLAKAVSFTFTDYNEQPEGDTIYYAAARPLTWKDFQSKIRPPGPFSAVVMPNFGYNLTQEVNNGVINVCLDLKTYVAKSDCWVGGNKDVYGLLHEQRHFDIAKIITRQFRQKILAARLTPDTYEAFISMQYLDSYRDMNALQKAYDKETRHGVFEQQQAEWNKKIDAMLKE
ncbi:hypothetical protein ACFQZS_10550 [Mucilaginibacter calamicampi]|uniref:DUF922 domain-containing protein n=1 Tax=Mucilaginibacter calamicampi TaxID=1302352 RepID=A0ABW2YXV1_9SPHI